MVPSLQELSTVYCVPLWINEVNEAVVNEAEIDVFLEFPNVLCDPVTVAI